MRVFQRTASTTRREGESFSDVIMRLAQGRRTDISRFARALKDSDWKTIEQNMRS